MPRPRSETLTERESQIMAVLWQEGACTAEQIRAGLPVDLHDSTVRTLLRVLEGKGYVRHSIRGKAYVYKAVMQQASAERKALRTLLKRFFGGSAESLVLRLIEDEQLSPGQLEQLRKETRKRGSS